MVSGALKAAIWVKITAVKIWRRPRRAGQHDSLVHNIVLAVVGSALLSAVSRAVSCGDAVSVVRSMMEEGTCAGAGNPSYSTARPLLDRSRR